MDRGTRNHRNDCPPQPRADRHGGGRVDGCRDRPAALPCGRRRGRLETTATRGDRNASVRPRVPTLMVPENLPPPVPENLPPPERAVTHDGISRDGAAISASGGDVASAEASRDPGVDPRG